jgi:hypothetical protein
MAVERVTPVRDIMSVAVNSPADHATSRAEPTLARPVPRSVEISAMGLDSFSR